MNSTAQTKLPERQRVELERIAALRIKEQPTRLVLSGQVVDDLVPYVKEALKTVSKTDLINLALASYFEVAVYEATPQ